MLKLQYDRWERASGFRAQAVSKPDMPLPPPEKLKRDIRLIQREQLEQDMRQIRRILWTMPLLSLYELAKISGLSQNRCHRILTRLRKKKKPLVARVSLGRRVGVRQRWFLTASGVETVAHETGLPIPWQVTETGLKWLVRRLDMLEAFYQLAPELWGHEGVRIGAPVYLTPDPDEEPVEFTPDLQMRDFCWIRDGEIHAVVRYQTGAWVALVWVGSMISEHTLRNKGALAIKQLEGGFQPAGWVLVGYDRLAAAQADEFWPASNVLSVTPDGHVEREMRPGPFTWPLRETAVPAALGRPERIIAWVNRENSPMGALKSDLNCRVFRFIAEMYGPTVNHLKQKFGEAYRAAVRALKRAGLVVKIGGSFYLGRLGELAAAQMDRVTPKSVRSRFDAYLKEDGLYRKQQERHNRAVIDVVLKFEQQQVEAFGGWRCRRAIPQDTQVVPDGALCLRRLNGTSVVAFLEVEFSGRTPVRIEKKVAPYPAVETFFGELIPSAWLLEDPNVERRYSVETEHMLALTGVLDEFLEGTSWGPDSVWRLGRRNEPIDELVYLFDTDIDDV